MWNVPRHKLFSLQREPTSHQVGALPVASGFRILNSKLRHAHHERTQAPLSISIGSPAGTEKLSGTFHSENTKFYLQIIALFGPFSRAV